MTALNEKICACLKKNGLFDGFSERQFNQVMGLVTEIAFQQGELIIQENEVSDNIFIIIEGQVEVSKWDPDTQHSHHLATLGVGSVIGEIAILDNAPRSATVRAIAPSKLISLPISKLRTLSDENATYAKIATHLTKIAQEAKILASEPALYPLMIQNLAKGLGKRIRTANDATVDALRNELEIAKAQVAMSTLVITIVVNLCLYIIIMKMLEVAGHYFSSTTIVDTPLIAVLATSIFISMLKSGYPLEFYGITRQNGWISLYEGLLAAALIMVLSVLLKWVLIHFNSDFVGRPLFEMNFAKKTEWIWVTIYVLFVPLQELIVRGGLQSSFQGLLTGKYRNLWAIVLSNLLFSVIHFHVSILLGLSVLVPGLLWGWMYARHRTLIGVCVSHAIVGVWALSVIGLY